MQTEFRTIEALRTRLVRVETELADALQRMPAHGVKRRFMTAPLDLEDERDRLLNEINVHVSATTEALARGAGRRIAFFEKRYTLCADRLLDDSGCAPTQNLAELIRRYLAAPTASSTLKNEENDWCSFRELRGAGPLVVNFANNTHKTIAVTFGSDLPALDCAAAKAAGHLEHTQGFDRSYRFQALPDVSLVLNYNAADDLFPAQAGLLFHRSAQTLLSIRDLFTLGTYLTGQLIANSHPSE
jgi:hypothetical protein